MKFNSDFRYDLEVGKVAEKQLAMILQNKKIEVKRDFKASQTGQVFVEFFSRGKPSGIEKSEADYWAFMISEESVVLLPTERLRALVEEAKANGKVKAGGDSNTSQGALIKIERLVM